MRGRAEAVGAGAVWTDGWRTRPSTAPPTASSPTALQRGDDCLDDWKAAARRCHPDSKAIVSSSPRAPSPSRAALRALKDRRRIDQKRLSQQLLRFEALAPVARALNKTAPEAASMQMPTIRDCIRRLGWFRHHTDSRVRSEGPLRASADEEIAA